MNITLPNTLAATDPVLLVQLLQWVQCCNATSPINAIQALQGPYVNDPGVQFIPGTSFATNCIIVWNPHEVLICIGGATTYLQIANLVAGIEEGPAAGDVTVAVSSFYYAARNILNQVNAAGGYVNVPVSIVGHSFGGATAQVLGALMSLTQTARSIKIWTFGAPRPGTATFASRLSYMNNYRFCNDGDVVPRLAPHGDEIPSIMVVSPPTLWRACNTLVQAPTGYVMNGTGQIYATMANPPADWTLTLGLTRYMAGVMVGGAGYNHGVQAYLNNAQLAVQNYPVPPPRPIQQPQAALTLRPREREALISIGTAEVFADATSPTGQTRTYVVPTVTDPAAPRYKAARDGKVWVIKLGEEIVGSATGKRRAKSIARHWNRSARATLNVGTLTGL